MLFRSETVEKSILSLLNLTPIKKKSLNEKKTYVETPKSTYKTLLGLPSLLICLIWIYSFLLVYLRQIGKKPLRNAWSTAAKLTIESD